MINTERPPFIKPDTQLNKRIKEAPSLRRSLARLAIAVPTAAVLVLAGLACGSSKVDLGLENVPFVAAKIKDENGDGVFTMRDVWIQKGVDWRAGYDVNADFSVDEKDENLELEEIGKKNADDKFDFDGDGIPTFKDVGKLRNHKGKVKNDKNPKVRLDELWAGISLREMYVRFEPEISDNDIRSMLVKHGLAAPLDKNGRLIRDDLLGEKGTYVFAIIPKQTLEDMGLESLLEKVAEEDGVIITDSVPASITLANSHGLTP